MKVPSRIMDDVYGIVYDTSDDLAAALDRLDYKDRQRMCGRIERSVSVTLDRAGLVVVVPASRADVQ